MEKRLRDQNHLKGMSLLEVTIAIGVASVLMLFIMNMSLVQQKQLGTITSKYERTSLIQEIREILTSKESCVATLGGLNANSQARGTISQIINVRGLIDDATNGEGIDPNLSDLNPFTSNTNEALAQSYGDDKIKFLSFSLSSSSLTPVGNETTGVTHLIIETISPEMTYARVTTHRMRVNVETDAAGRIVACGVAKIVSLSLDEMCSTLGGQFDPDGRGGVGNCFSLKLTGGLVVDGNLKVYDVSTTGADGRMHMLPSVNLLAGFNETVGGGVTAKAFCDTLGGVFVPSGRGGVGDCTRMKVQGGISMGGALNVKGRIRFLDGSPPVNPAVASSPKGTTKESICRTLGGTYNAAGRNAKGDCENIDSTTAFSVSGDISTGLDTEVD